MRTILTLLLFVPILGFSQDLRESTYDINYIGKSKYTVHKESFTGFIRLKRLEKRCIKAIQKWTTSIGGKFEVVNTDYVKAGLGITPKVTVTFRLLEADGSVWLTKNDAIAKLKEAKELLDLEMITRPEYEKLKQELAPIINKD